jgi:hypothetical protein
VDQAAKDSRRRQEAILSGWRHRLDQQPAAGIGEEEVRRNEPRTTPSSAVKAWIEFELIDEDGKPVPGRRPTSS